jgi:hypothetical protein
MKVKFLTVIWGARYIDEFARISLPSYLAPGNLPYVASATELEIVILTSTEGRAHFGGLPIMAKLEALCPVRFVLIDDLITSGVYGVTLTLAYARGILATGAEQTSTHFLFMNSDFVLADGALRATISKLREGYPCVMAPSLRASAESTLPTLTRALSADDYVLSMPPRDMVQLAFDNLHPTVIAKTVTQEFVSCETHNQIYWQVDGTTLLARYHLIFMLAIKPEVPIGPVNSYCDYGFVPELVPSGKLGFMNDSDEFFMLELQPSTQELQLLHSGTKSPSKIAAELSRWTTREHRRCAEVDLVFHTGSCGTSLEEARAAAARFTADLHSRMKLPAINHVDHYYWVNGVQAWISLKFTAQADVILPSELPLHKPAGRAWSVGDFWWYRDFRWYSDFLGTLRRYIGKVPDVPVWHTLWLDSRLLLGWIDRVKSESASRVLLICADNSPLPKSLPEHLPVDVVIVADDEDPPGFASESYNWILVHIERGHILHLRSRIALAERYVGVGGTISIFVENKSELDHSNFSSELSHHAGHILPSSWMGYRVEVQFVGGRLKRRLRLAERSLYRFLLPASLSRLPHMLWGAGGWVLVAGLTALNNLCTRRASSCCPDYCTSALLSLSRRNSVPSDEIGSASHGYQSELKQVLPGE